MIHDNILNFIKSTTKDIHQSKKSNLNDNIFIKNILFKYGNINQL